MRTPTPFSLVRVENVTRTYLTKSGEIHALRGVSLEAPRGVLIALKGRSGSGKTTLLNIIGGLDHPTCGEVVFDGQYFSMMNDFALTMLRRQRMGIIFQSFALLPTYSAFENVEFVLRLAGKSIQTSRERAKYCLKVVGLSNRMYNRPDELSGGQQQRLAVARAIANRPDMILADEPTGELDTKTTHQIFRLFRLLIDREGMTFMVTTHDPLIDEYADMVYSIHDGKILTN